MPRRIWRERREDVEQRLAIAPADGALQGRQIFREAAQHFQHRFLVVQEHVAPHGGIGGGDAGEVAEAAGRILDHFGRRHLLEIGRRRDDVVGDEMRQMAGDGEHQVMMLGRHRLDIRAAGPPELRQLLDGLRISVGQRRQDAPAIDEEFGKTRLRPGLLRAGNRVARNEMNAGRHMRRHVAHDRTLHGADIGEDGAGLQARGRSPPPVRHRCPPANTGSRDRHLRPPRRAVGNTASTSPSSLALVRVASLLA